MKKISIKIHSLISISIIVSSCSILGNRNNMNENNQSENQNVNHPLSADFLSLSDIHFNPYDYCTRKNADFQKCRDIVKDLVSSDVKQWNSIFQKHYSGDLSLSEFGQNTNYPLFQSLLKQLKENTQVQQSQFVVILGDTLGHDFVGIYKKLYPLAKQEEIQSFINKTLVYINSNVKNSLSRNIGFFPVIGNNDSYIEDYNVDNPKINSFYEDFNKNINELNNSNDVSFNFTESGYYYAKLKINNLNIISLNTNPFSANAINNDAVNIDKEIEKELDWLSKSFNDAKEKNRRVLILTHIPIGIDAYTSIKMKYVTPFWSANESKIANKYVKILKDNSSNILGIMMGHTHNDTYSIIDKELNLFEISTSSVTPSHYNNSSFKIYSIDKNEIKDFSTYYLDRSEANPMWKLEYTFTKFYKANSLNSGIKNFTQQWESSKTINDKYLNFYNVGSDSSFMKNNWKYYACAANYILIKEFENCLNETK
jgi:sphingomyelin phosphodiesterase acid-like 3